MRGSSSSARRLAANASSKSACVMPTRQRPLSACAVRDPGMGLRETLVAPDGLAEELDGRVHFGVGTVPQASLAAQVEIVGLGVAGAATLDELALLPAQVTAQRTDELLRNLGLDREDVAQVAIVALRPQVVAVHRAHELRRDPHTLACLADAAFEHRAHTERAADLAHVGGAALELE